MNDVHACPIVIYHTNSPIKLNKYIKRMFGKVVTLSKDGIDKCLHPISINVVGKLKENG